MAQANDLGRAAGGRGLVQLPDQLPHLVTEGFITPENKPVAALIGRYAVLAGSVIATTLAQFRRSQFLQQLDHIAHPGLFELDHLHLVFGRTVELSHNLFDALDIGRVVADDQGIGGRHPRQVAILGHERAQDGHQFEGIGVIDLNNTGNQLL